MISNLEYYKVFYFVAREGSVTKASKQLNISQPAVSQALKQLESDMGTRLFARNARGMELTEAGKILYSFVSEGYEMIISGEKRVGQLLNMELGEVHIGASDMTLKYFLLPYLEKFHEMYPGIKVSVSNAPTPETIGLLKDGTIDFGVVSSPFVQDEDMECVEVRDIEDIFVAGKKFNSYKNRLLDYEELANLPIICLEGTTSTKTYVDGYLKGYNVELKSEFELATSDMIVQFALRSLGVGSVVRDFAQEEIDKGNLFEIKLRTPIPKRKICVITDQKRIASVATSNLLKLIKKG